MEKREGNDKRALQQQKTPNSQLLLNWKALSDQPNPCKAHDHAPVQNHHFHPGMGTDQTRARRNSTNIQSSQHAALLGTFSPTKGAAIPPFHHQISISVIFSTLHIKHLCLCLTASLYSLAPTIVALHMKLQVRIRVKKITYP